MLNCATLNFLGKIRILFLEYQKKKDGLWKTGEMET